MIFTDNSKQISRRVGAAAYIKNYDKTIEWRISDVHRVVSAEMFAIYKALLWIDNGNPKNDKYVIFKDSHTFVYIIWNSCKSYSNIIAKIHKLLYTLTNLG